MYLFDISCKKSRNFCKISAGPVIDCNKLGFDFESPDGNKIKEFIRVILIFNWLNLLMFLLWHLIHDSL